MINKNRWQRIFLTESHIKNPTQLFIITLLITIGILITIVILN
jgi:hypothetical protein